MFVMLKGSVGKQKSVSANESDLGGYKEVILLVGGR
jgi:hypothetical protein